MDEITKDERFAHITKDPRFRSMSKKQRKVKIDKRFESMFHDKRFKLKYSVDKRGKPMNFTTNENLKKYYELSDGSHSDDDSAESVDDEDELIANLSKKSLSNSFKLEKGVDENKQIPDDAESVVDNKNTRQASLNTKFKKNSLKKTKIQIKNKNQADINTAGTDSEDESMPETDDESETIDDSEGGDSSPRVGDDAPDYARGEGLIESSSDEDDDDDEDVDDSFDHGWGELDKNVEEAEELTSRLAVCNMDWDRIKAQDLFVVFNSFKPADGVINSIHIYPSEFGLQRMKEEQEQGPKELKELARQVDVDADEESEEEEEDTDGNRYHREKLRQYQLNRLKYYYAVVVCDSVETASKIYDECDGKEFESSSAKIDLRYIPDGMTFDQTPKSECFSLPHSSYKSSIFFTSALCQSKVDLTWDETDHDRLKMTMKPYDKKGEVNEEDFKVFLASESEDEDQDHGNLDAQSDGEDISDEDKQIEKYKSLLKDIDDSSTRKGDMEMEIEWEPGLKETTEDIIKTKEKNKDQTPWQSYLEQKKEKKKQKKEEQKRKRLAKRESKIEKTFSDDELPTGVDVSDSFFTGLNKANTKTSKKKKKKKKAITEEEEEKQKKEEAELSLLMMDEEENGKQHFSLNDLVEGKKKKKKVKNEAKLKSEDDFEMDVDDNRFDAVFKSHLFNIDPSAPEFKKTKGIEKIIEEKLKRRKGESGHEVKTKKVKLVIEKEDEEKDELKPRKEESLSSLVKSVKAKTQQFQTKKKKKR